MIKTHLLAAAVLASTVAAAHADLMTGKEIRDAVAGKRIYLAVPLGGEFPLHYKNGGVVDGSGEAVGLGRWMSPNDSGRWWIDGNSLCQQWRTWYEGKKTCFTLQRIGGNKLQWVRDDGYSGVARIGK